MRLFSDNGMQRFYKDVDAVDAFQLPAHDQDLSLGPAQFFPQRPSGFCTGLKDVQLDTLREDPDLFGSKFSSGKVEDGPLADLTVDLHEIDVIDYVTGQHPHHKTSVSRDSPIGPPWHQQHGVNARKD